jgi:hypothetical protein
MRRTECPAQVEPPRSEAKGGGSGIGATSPSVLVPAKVAFPPDPAGHGADPDGGIGVRGDGAVPSLNRWFMIKKPTSAVASGAAAVRR